MEYGMFAVDHGVGKGPMLNPAHTLHLSELWAENHNGLIH